MTRLLVLLTAATLLACTSIPLSTIMRMSSFDETDFVQLDPDQLKVRVVLPNDFLLNAEKTTLTVGVVSKERAYSDAFSLVEEAVESRLVSPRLFSAKVAATAYTLRLTEHSKEKFRELQRFVRLGDTGDVTLNIGGGIEPARDGVTTTSVWIELHLSQKEGFITLVEAAPVELARAASGAQHQDPGDVPASRGRP